MLGVGVFAAVGPAARAAGSGLLIGLVLAAAVAYCNATSSGQLAALYPQSGGTYVYGRERLGAVWGNLAGWGFVVGKTASCAAMALTVGSYAAPSVARPIALVSVFGVTAVNYRGVRKTVAATRVIVAIVLGALAVVVIAGVAGGNVSSAYLHGIGSHGALGILESAGLLFIAFAGYARIATLGEEVTDPATTIPRAIPLALGVCVTVYAVVLSSALLAVGPVRLAAARAPLVAVVRAGDLAALSPIVRVGGAVAALGVLLSLSAGVSRTVFAMASGGTMPRWFDAVHPTSQIPHRAELIVGAAAAALVATTDLRHTLALSAATILGYYAITNAAALTLRADERRWPRALAFGGLGGCAVLGGAVALWLATGG
jgi:APA family basic amino acid/polyamine antiporter